MTGGTGGNKRNDKTYHDDKSRRRQRALDRMPALLAMPEAPIAPKPAAARAPKNRKGRSKEEIALVANVDAVLTQHEQDLFDAQKRDHVYAVSHVDRHNARVTAERATLLGRIGKPPRQWPKKERPIAMNPSFGAPYMETPALDEHGEWDSYMSIPQV